MLNRYNRVSMDGDIHRRRKHLAAYLKPYERVSSILFDTILARCADLEASVYKVQYFPRPRLVQVAVGWGKSDYHRSSGFFCLWRGGIFHRGDIDSWPKMVCRVEKWTPIVELSDSEIIEQLLTAIGAPWADRFAVPKEAGALRHDAKFLLKTISGMQHIAPPSHQQAVDILVRQIADFAQEIGA